VRVTGSCEAGATVWVNGGGERPRPGTWSATSEWLVRRLAPRFPVLGFAEVRYRSRSWRQLHLCVDDALEALSLVADRGAPRCALVGFSMGGAVAAHAASHPAVARVIALAPWLPERLDLTALARRPVAIAHGALDRPLPGVPGLSPAQSIRAWERLRALGADATYTRLPGAFHGAAVRRPGGRLVPLPGAARWESFVAVELERFSDRL
jgi:dienelactone hydrolase